MIHYNRHIIWPLKFRQPSIWINLQESLNPQCSVKRSVTNIRLFQDGSDGLKFSYFNISRKVLIAGNPLVLRRVYFLSLGNIFANIHSHSTEGPLNIYRLMQGIFRYGICIVGTVTSNTQCLLVSIRENSMNQLLFQ